jgi:hypothetical protein
MFSKILVDFVPYRINNRCWRSGNIVVMKGIQGNFLVMTGKSDVANSFKLTKNTTVVTNCQTYSPFSTSGSYLVIVKQFLDDPNSSKNSHTLYFELEDELSTKTLCERLQKYF